MQAPPSSRAPHWTARLQDFDRRWLFLAMGLAVVIPLLAPINLPVEPSPMVEALYHTVEELGAGDVVFMSLDLDPASTPELEPFYRAVLLQLKRKGVKIVLATTWYQAPPLIERWLRETMDAPLIDPQRDSDYTGTPDRAYENHVDYVWLGFREGKEVTISSMGRNLRATFDDQAADGTPLADIPLMKGIERLAHFQLLILVSAGYPGVKEYVQQVQTRYDLAMVAACTAVSTTDYTPYFDTGQLLGLAGGLAASAEYELLVGKRGRATQGADVLNVGHLVVILAIVLGNFIYFAGRWHTRRRRA